MHLKKNSRKFPKKKRESFETFGVAFFVNESTPFQYRVCIPTKQEIVAQKTPIRTSIWTQA